MSELAFILILSGREKERERLKEGEIETTVKEERREEETDNTFLFCTDFVCCCMRNFLWYGNQKKKSSERYNFKVNLFIKSRSLQLAIH